MQTTKNQTETTSAKNVTCDQCKTRFATRIVTERLSGGGEQWSFTCPHCGHRYNVCHITRQGIELRRQLDSVKAQLRLAPHRDDLAQKREQLRAAYLQEVTSLITLGHDNDDGLTNAVLTTPPMPE